MPKPIPQPAKPTPAKAAPTPAPPPRTPTPPPKAPPKPQRKKKEADEPDLSYISADLRPLAVECSSLVPDPANARDHDTRGLGAIQGSLAAYGQQKPIVARRDTRVVIAGNGTLEATIALGRSHIAVVFSDLEPTLATGYGIADNRTAELAGWQDDRLAQILTTLQEEQVDLLSQGWNQEELDRLLKGPIEEPQEPEVDPDGEEEPNTFDLIVHCPSEADREALSNQLEAEGIPFRQI